eukprot:518468_1
MSEQNNSNSILLILLCIASVVIIIMAILIIFLVIRRTNGNKAEISGQMEMENIVHSKTYMHVANKSNVTQDTLVDIENEHSAGSKQDGQYQTIATINEEEKDTEIDETEESQETKKLYDTQQPMDIK